MDSDFIKKYTRCKKIIDIKCKRFQKKRVNYAYLNFSLIEWIKVWVLVKVIDNRQDLSIARPKVMWHVSSSNGDEPSAET